MQSLKPINTIYAPKYPLKKEILRNPRLMEPLPQRWIKNAGAGVAAGLAVAMLLTGCADSTTKHTPSGTKTQTAQPAKPSPHKLSFFEHGQGRGSFGCVSVVPAVYLTEDEAFDVISGIAKHYGLDFKAGVKSVETDIPKVQVKHRADENEPFVVKVVEKGVLALDGYDKDKNIGFEFISLPDMDEWNGTDLDNAIVLDYYSLETAKALNASFNADGIPAAVFYEPFEGRNDHIDSNNTQELMSNMREKSLEALKQQAIDFMEWLKSQGII